MLRLIILLLLVPLIGGAQDTVKVALTLTPEQQAELDYNNGIDALKKNDHALAADLFTRCLLVKNSLEKAYANRAVAYTHLKKYDEAVEDIGRAIALSPQNPAYYYNKSLIFFAEGKKDSQDVALDKCLGLDAAHADAAYYKGMLCYERREFDRSVGYFGIAIQNKPDYVFAYNDRGSAYRAKGDLENAINDYLAALQLDSTHVFIYNNLGSAYRLSGKTDLAIGAYNRAFRLNPKYTLALLNRGCTYFDMGNYKAAQSDFEEVLFIEPNNSAAYNNLASIALKNKEYKKAKELASRAIELDSKNGQAFYNRGIAAQLLREEDACCADWKSAYALGVEGAKVFINTSCKE